MENEKKTADETGSSSKNIKVSTIVESILVLVFIIFIIGILAHRFFPSFKDTNLGSVFEKISYPLVSIDGKNVIYDSDIKENLEVLKKFYESENVIKAGNRIDFSTDDGKKRLKIKEREVLDKKIENKIIELISEKRGIEVKRDEINEYANWKISDSNFLGQDMDDFSRSYGWGEEQIKNEIIKPIIYTEKLRKNVESEFNSSKELKDKIEMAKKELGEGRDFAEVARKYSEGKSVEDGGEIGWINMEQIIPEVAEKVFSNNFQLQGQFEIIESELGYHIIKIEEIKKEDGKDMVKLRQIIVLKKTFAQWLDEEMRKMDIKIMGNEYRWNKEKSKVEFSDESMNEFEKLMGESLMGDPSVSKPESQKDAN